MGDTELQALRARLVVATGPNRRLDYLICLAVGDKEAERARTSDRHYTGSLDAATTLLPKDYVVSHLAWGRKGASVVIGPRKAPDMASCDAATPALALCLARIEYEIAMSEARGK